MISLPYFDLLFDSRKKGEPVADVFDRFVHWGYWDPPSSSTGSREDFLVAMEKLNRQVLDPAALGDGQAVLDAGCGFGGTIASIDRMYRRMKLIGLNIDPRQLELARTRVSSIRNDIRFVAGDACELPFPDRSFDRVLAVECIFHFPSRLKFLKEAARVLRPDGLLSISDFVPVAPSRSESTFVGRWLESRVSKGYGGVSGWPDGGYEAIAAAAGLKLELDRDITKQTLPTYPALRRLIKESSSAAPLSGPTRWLEWLSRLGIVRYRILSFRKLGTGT
jgi:SAM-dependent methyltransferase